MSTKPVIFVFTALLLVWTLSACRPDEGLTAPSRTAAAGMDVMDRIEEAIRGKLHGY